MSCSSVHLPDDGATAAFPLRLVWLTLLASLSTLVSREPTSLADHRFDMRAPGLRSVVLCFGGEIGLLLLLAERPERVPGMVVTSRRSLTGQSQQQTGGQSNSGGKVLMS